MKKTGTSVCADVPVCNQGLYEFSVNAASWIVHELFYFKCKIQL